MNRRKYNLVPIEDPMETNSKTKKNEKVRNRIHRFPFSIYVIVAICVIIAGFCFIYKKTPAVNPQNKKTKHDANSTKDNQGIENNKPYRPLPLIEEMDHENCKYQPKNVTQQDRDKFNKNADLNSEARTWVTDGSLGIIWVRCKEIENSGLVHILDSTQIHIVNKCNCKTNRVKNIGTEGYGYATWIVNNYNNLPDYSLFLHGDVDHHISGNSLEWKLGNTNITGKEKKCTWANINEGYVHERIFDWDHGLLDKFYSEDIINSIPDIRNKKLSHICCAQMIVSKEIIQQYSLEFWKVFANFVAKENIKQKDQRDAGGVYEMVWHAVFSNVLQISRDEAFKMQHDCFVQLKKILYIISPEESFGDDFPNIIHVPHTK